MYEEVITIMCLEWGLISFGTLFLSFFLLLVYFTEYREERKFERVDTPHD